MGILGRVARILVGSTGITSGTDRQLLSTGLLGRGLITSIEQTNTTVGSRQTLNYQVVCDITLEVTLTGRPPYSAALQQGVRMDALASTTAGETVVVVRVDPNDATCVVIDYALTLVPTSTEPTVSGPWSQASKSVTITAGSVINLRHPEPSQRGSAADVLTTGNPVRVELLQCAPYPAKGHDGNDVYLFALAVSSNGPSSFGVRVGNPVPPDALRLLTLGRTLPARQLESSPSQVVIDWAEALHEYPS